MVLSNAFWLYLFTEDSKLAFNEETGPLGPADKLDALSTALTAAVTDLKSTGHSVLLVQTVPHWGIQNSMTWDSCSVLRAERDGCVRTVPLSEVLSRQGAVGGAVEAVATNTSTDVLDVTAQICPHSLCSTIGPNGLVPYHDGTHITVAQSKALAPVFEEIIGADGP